MTEIETKDWPIDFWWEVIKWCDATLGPSEWGEWFLDSDYAIWLSSKNLTVFTLRWS